MKLFLQIDIGFTQNKDDEEPWVRYASSLADDIIGTEIESESDPRIADTVIKLAHQVKRILFLVMIHDPLAPTGNMIQVFSRLLETGAPVSVVLAGSHPVAEKQFDQLEKKLTRVNKLDEVRTLIREFAQ